MMDDEYTYGSQRYVAVLSPKLDTAVALNVIAHLSISVAAPLGMRVIGRPVLCDGSGIEHRGIARDPVIVKTAKPSRIRIAIQRARELETVVASDFTRETLEAGHDDELAASLMLVAEPELQYLGAMFYGPRDEIDAICGKFSLWRRA